MAQLTDSGGNALRPVGSILLPLPDSNDDTQEADNFQPGFPYFIESNDDGSPKRPPDPNGGIVMVEITQI